MPKTLLAVDDSATMRKVLEITFSGEDFHVVTAENAQAAIAKLGERPAAVVIDTGLAGDDGYALAKEIRKKDPAAAIVLLSSRYNPYDAAKGKDCGADDYMDKPFDTQQMIDKVRKAMLTKEQGAGAAATPAAGAAAARPAAPGFGAAAGAAAAKPAEKAPQRTLMFGEGVAPGAVKPEPKPIVAPAPSPAAPAAAAPAPSSVTSSGGGAAMSASVNGQMAGKLAELGLSAQQADAVMALSREVVERVVWEVVPQLAEAIIKEEIARLTRP